jgi:hypothetical protein
MFEQLGCAPEWVDVGILLQLESKVGHFVEHLVRLLHKKGA